MNIYIAKRMVISENDEFDGALIFANSEQEAKNMKPRKKLSVPYDTWEEDVVIVKIGVTDDTLASSGIKMVSRNFGYTGNKYD